MFLFSQIIIGFVSTKKRLLGIQYGLLGLLILNLMVAAINLVKPNITLIPGLYGGGIAITNLAIGGALRLGGLTFRWEAFAQYLMMVVIFLSSLLVKTNMLKRNKIFCFLLFLLSFVELLLTNTRVPIIIGLAGLTLLVLFNKEYSGGKKCRIIFTGALIFVLLIFIAGQTGELKIVERLKGIKTIEYTKYGPLPGSRATVWTSTIDHIIDQRFIGSGPAFIHRRGYLNWPHNTPLMILYTIGIYGLFAYLLLFSRFVQIIRCIRTIPEGYCKNFFFALWMSLLLFSIDALKFDGFLRATLPYFYFIWLVIALVFCAANFSNREKS